jgi:hypothetical protein
MRERRRGERAGVGEKKINREGEGERKGGGVQEREKAGDVNKKETNLEAGTSGGC